MCDRRFVNETANYGGDNCGRKDNPTQMLEVGDKDIIFVVFMRVGNFRVYVLAICKFNKFHSEVWGGKGMMGYRWVIYH